VSARVRAICDHAWTRRTGSSGHGETRACIFGSTGPSSLDLRLRRLRRSVLGSGAALDANRPPRTLEESVCAPPSAREPLCTECLGPPRYLVVSSKRVAIVCRSPSRCEARRLKLGPHQDPDHARTRMLPFAWTGF
jgi:hypothetical protein